MANAIAINENLDADSVYNAYYGNVSNETVIYDVMGTRLLPITSKDTSNMLVHTNPLIKAAIEANEASKNKNEYEAKIKALTSQTGGPGTAGWALVPVEVDYRIVDKSRIQTPGSMIMPKVTNKGLFAAFNVITAKGEAHTGTEMGALTVTDDSIDRVSVEIKYLRSVGKVSGVAMSAVPGYLLEGIGSSGLGFGGNGGFSNQAVSNAMQLRIYTAVRSLQQLEEDLLFNGNKTTSGIVGDPDGTEFDGIVTIMGATNKLDKAGSALALNDYITAAGTAYSNGGYVNVAFADVQSFLDTQKLLTAKIGFLNSTKKTDYGFSAMTINTIAGELMIIPSRYLSTVSTAKSIYLLDLSVWEFRQLQGVTYELLGKDIDGQKFFVKKYETLICRAPQFNSSIQGIL